MSNHPQTNQVASRLLIASTNEGKLEELQPLLDDLNLTLLLPIDLNLKVTIDEYGRSYAENAMIKAMAYSLHSGILTLADDSGLEVEVLRGKPGIFSARYGLNEGYSGDAGRRTFLLKTLREHFYLQKPWRASFHCSVVIASWSSKKEFEESMKPNQFTLFEGVCNGIIIEEERGTNGFGYDPLFLIPELGKTMAELSKEEKNHLSHRARAIAAARPFLRLLNSYFPPT